MTTQVEWGKPATPAANPRHLADALTDPNRIARAHEAHRDGLRKLRTAAAVAASSGATWDEMLAALRDGVTEAAGEGNLTAGSSATARARVHNGDDTL